MEGRSTSRKLKGKVLMFCVTLACLYGLEMAVALRDNRGCRFARTNWVRRIAGVKRMGRMREIGVQMSLTKCRLRRARHLMRIGGREREWQSERTG